jgi:hypothetical protein
MFYNLLNRMNLIAMLCGLFILSSAPTFAVAQEASISQLTEGLFVMSYNAQLSTYCEMPPSSIAAIQRTLAALEEFARANLQASVVDSALSAGLADLVATKKVLTKAELCEPAKLALLPSMLEDALAELLPIVD